MFDMWSSLVPLILGCGLEPIELVITIMLLSSPARAFLIGAGLMAVSVKSWVFTLAAISVIGNAGMQRAANMVSYVVLVALAAGGNLLIIGVAAVFPQRSRSLLTARCAGWRTTTDSWWSLPALRGFGISP